MLTQQQENYDLSLLNGLSVLYVEDDALLRKKMVDLLEMLFHKVYSAENGSRGIEAFEKNNPDIIITDIRMPVMDGLEMSREIKQKSPTTPIIITTAFNDVEFLMKAIEVGVDRYVQKPIDEPIFLDALFKCGLPHIQQQRIDSLSSTLHSTLLKKLGESPPMREVVRLVEQVAGTDFSVVLQGETGVGKSMVAGIIHDLSPRSKAPFITVDVGSIPETLIESELFGHKKGAFTGANSDKKGYLERADGGTVFFDELENMSLGVQAKLLRAVEEKKIYPLGSTTAVTIDVRLVCATNQDFKTIVAEKKFREDLFYRLFEFDIPIPPLRQRQEDIPFLAQLFVREAVRELNKKNIRLSRDATDFLLTYEWPGNVRQFKNILRRAVLLCHSSTVTAGQVKKLITPGPPEIQAGENDLPGAESPPPPLALEELEKWAIREALKRADGKRMKAAVLLQIDYKRLVRKMKKYGIGVPR